MDRHLGIAAQTLWQEARGEALIGQQAVAHVIVNRLKDGRWGKTLGEVCLSEFRGEFQFSGWNRNDPNRVPSFQVTDEALAPLAAVIEEALKGAPDPTGGATHYYAVYSTTPTWVLGAEPCGMIGKHVFFRGVK